MRFPVLLTIALVAPVVFTAGALLDSQGAHAAPDAVAAGRRVYVAEGCIHCHSQYLRPGTDPDVLGDARVPDFSTRQDPPLIGNRRLGPDLMNVGLRRTLAWQRLHLVDPRAVSPGSRMPAYGHLFEGDGANGDALLTYLDSLGTESLASHRTSQAGGPREPSATSTKNGNSS